LVEPESGPDILELAYTGGYTLWLDCQRRGAIRFQYNAQRDQGDFPRSSRFFLDPDVLERRKQFGGARSSMRYSRITTRRPRRQYPYTDLPAKGRILA
jgi:endonuclease G